MSPDPVRWIQCGLLAAVLLAAGTAAVATGVYKEPEAFIAEVFGDDPPRTSTLWIKGGLKDQINVIMGHDLGVLRLRYWGRGRKTAWILEEIGKSEPITTGIVVDHGEIARLEVLIFRESRGWEVRYPFFTRQFKGASLAERDRLDRRIDGITGATLSVRALEKVAALALYLHRQTPFAGDSTSE